MQNGVMYSRVITLPPDKSFFLFGPRGTGKTTLIKARFPDALHFDLLASETYKLFLASPQRIEQFIPPEYQGWIVIDEIQRVPELLNEVHRLIETRHLRFVLTGSSARKLRQKGVNLLAGRALTCHLHPLTAPEVGQDFNLDQALLHGQMPSRYVENSPAAYLSSYVHTYIREEVLQEGLTRNLGAFARFLEAASFSQASLLNIAEVARECGVNRKVVEEYFRILEDLLLAFRLPVFSKRASRRLTSHPKFFFFDAGVFRAIRPKGPLDRPEEIDGAALETLVFQEIRAGITNSGLECELFFWRAASGHEVDFVVYGQSGIIAIEVKRTANIRSQDLTGLRAFLSDYPMAQAFLFYGGAARRYEAGITFIPLSEAFHVLPQLL